MTTFIYALCEPYPNHAKIRYVGKADDPYARYEAHCNNARYRHTYKDRWIQKLQSEGKEPQLEVLEEVPKAEWPSIEQEYIRVFRAIGFQLTNLTKGGEGTEGRTHRPESLEKMAAAARGKIQSNVTIEKRVVWIRGKKQSPEHIEKRISQKRGLKDRTNSASHYVGVTWNRREGAWRAQIPTPRGRRAVRCKSEEAAARLYNKAALAVWGSEARLNIIL